MNKNKLLVIGLILALALGAYGAFKSPSTVRTIVGSVTGPDTTFDHFSVGGGTIYPHTVSYQSATTTVCAIQSPISTSTLVFGSAQFTVSSSTATVITLAKAATRYATTTIFNNQSISANAQGTVMASSSPVLTTGAINDLVFAPSQWFVVGMSGGIGTFSPSGSCSADFRVN